MLEKTAEAEAEAGTGGGCYGQRAGGGSGWVYTQANYNTWKSGNSTDANKYLLNSSYYLTDAATVAGNTSTNFNAPGGGTETGHAGNGYAKITRTN